MTREEIYNEDMQNIMQAKSIDWEKLQDAVIFVTGGTGLIGSTLIKGIMSYNRCYDANIKVLVLARNIKKVESIFGKFLQDKCFKVIIGDVNHLPQINESVDYIIHGASITASSDFVQQPVDTILTAVGGTNNILKLAREKKIKGMVYMSSMEVYGTPIDGMPLSEDDMGYLNPLAVRSSYSESKQMAENLCVAYYSQYEVPIRIARLTQTFGPGVTKNDNRVFAEFARCAKTGEDIVLQTKGETERMYLYTGDAVIALLTILCRGKNGEAYNVANESTYCSIKEMAELVAENFSAGKSKVVINIPDTPNQSYNPPCHINLDCSKIKQMGWEASKDMKEMFARMIYCM